MSEESKLDLRSLGENLIQLGRDLKKRALEAPLMEWIAAIENFDLGEDFWVELNYPQGQWKISANPRSEKAIQWHRHMLDHYKQSDPGPIWDKLDEKFKEKTGLRLTPVYRAGDIKYIEGYGYFSAQQLVDFLERHSKCVLNGDALGVVYKEVENRQKWLDGADKIKDRIQEHHLTHYRDVDWKQVSKTGVAPAFLSFKGGYEDPPQLAGDFMYCGAITGGAALGWDSADRGVEACLDHAKNLGCYLSLYKLVTPTVGELVEAWKI